MKFPRRLKIGDLGWLDWDGSPRNHVRVGDRLLPSEILVNFPSERENPALYMRLCIKDGVPSCAEIRITSKDTSREVRTSDLRAVPLESWIEQLYALTALRLEERPDGSTVGIMDGTEDRNREAAKVIQRARAASRRTVTRERLEEVARIYRLNINKNPTEAVARTFGVAHRTAAKYVQLARNEKPPLLPATTPGKRKA